MEGGAGALSQIPHLTFGHSSQPLSLPLLAYLSPSPGRSQVVSLTQGAKDQRTKVDTDFFSPFLAGEMQGHQKMKESRRKVRGDLEGQRS